MSTESQVCLASASPRRKALLTQIGVPCAQVASNIDEQVLPDEAAEDYVQRIAAAKALATRARVADNTVVLAADTAVVIDGQILGKPVDQADAARMLKLLSGREHQVMTAVSVLRGAEQRAVLVSSSVFFRPLTTAEITAYWQTGEPADKAGGYAIQGLGAVFVASLQGSYSGVVGLPLRETADLLASFGVSCWQPV